MPFESLPFMECDGPCVFPTVTIGDDQPEDNDLKEGMEVMLPCEGCGTPPETALTWYDDTLEQVQQSFDKLLVDKEMLLFHWSPSVNRSRINKLGLVPGRRPTTHSEYRAGYICFADTPKWAWELSGKQRSAPAGEWDLWQVWASDLVDPHILPAPDVDNGIHEVRTEHRVYKRHLWLVAGRVKEPSKAQ